MGQITRTTTSSDDWATGPAPEATDGAQAAQDRRARQTEAQAELGHAMLSIGSGLRDLTETLANAMEGHADDLQYDVLAETVAWLQDVRRELGTAEAYVARELGRMIGCPDVIELADGRRAEVLKGKDRKEWRHEDWKRDVRSAVLTEAGLADHDLIHPETGETLEPADLLALLAKVQAVHGSAAPKVTALKPLGLSADDYCTTGPGPYAVRISAPASTTTEQEN
jgi:hypothetical protein